MTTILDALQKGTGYLEKQGVESARLNMQHLLAHVVGCDRMQLYVAFDQPLEEEQLEKLRALMKERAGGKPLQHLLGTVEFRGLEFLCDERALIPRPETEHLVDLLAQRDDWPDGARILDLGTGSGVIGLSLAAALREKRPKVTLADISAEALTLAKENADRLAEKIDGSEVILAESDLFSALDGEFDLIVANLPYVADADMADLSPEVRRDPELALRGGGGDGNALMRKFLADAPAHLASGGTLAMEFGLGQEQALEAAARENNLSDVRILKDLESRDRILLAESRNSA